MESMKHLTLEEVVNNTFLPKRNVTKKPTTMGQTSLEEPLKSPEPKAEKVE